MIEKTKAEEAIARGKEALNSGDSTQISNARDEIAKLAMELGQKLYSANSAENGAGANPESGDDGATKSEGDNPNKEKVVDADYTVVDEDQQKK